MSEMHASVLFLIILGSWNNHKEYLYKEKVIKKSLSDSN